MEKRFQTKLQMVMHFLRGAKRYFFLAVVFACLVSVLDLVNPKIIGYTIDCILSDKASALPAFINEYIDSIGGIPFLRTHLGFVAAAVLGTACLSGLCRFLFRTLNARGAEKLVKTMRDDLFSHILRLPFRWHSENHTGEIIQRSTSDVEQVKMFLSEQLTMMIRVTVLIAFAVYFMFRIHVKLALAAFIFIPVVISYSYFFHHRIGSAFEKVDNEEARLSSIAQENLTGVRVVRAFGRETYERERFEKQNTYYTGMWVHLFNLLAAFWSSNDFFSYMQVLLVTVFGSYLCVHGELTAGRYIEFISYNLMLAWPVRMLGRVIANMSKAGISIERIMYIMNAEEEKDREDACEPDMHQDIVFDHVSFRYGEDSAEILNNVSFTVKAGSTLGILGATGSGKSTLAYLLDRLYELPEENGTITVGGVDIRDIKMQWLRTNIGMVLQEPYLFSRTLKENIAITSSRIEMEDVKRSADIAALDDAVEHFSEGYETYVGERGVTLSGGQKQRTAIAQMLIRKPPVMIFDDSLSAVDAETDAKIRKSLKESDIDATVILIAHRITTLMHADEIIVMDKGRIAEHGSHEELLAANGIYRKIYDLQSAAEEETYE